MKKVMDLVLWLAGSALAYEFFVILVRGEINPIPNLPLLIAIAIGAIGVTGLGLWGAVKMKSMTSCLLCGVGAGLLLYNVIAPVTVALRGYSLSAYGMVEGNIVVLLAELAMSSAIAAFGFTGCIIKERRN